MCHLMGLRLLVCIKTFVVFDTAALVTSSSAVVGSACYCCRNESYSVCCLWPLDSSNSFAEYLCRGSCFLSAGSLVDG